MTFTSTRQNLLLDVKGSNQSVKPGEAPVTREVTLINQGNKIAKVDVWLEPADEKSAPLLTWYQLSQRTVEVPAQGRTGLRLTVEVPQRAESGVYRYDLCAQAAVQYPGEVFRSSQQLQVVPTEQDVRSRREPSFVLDTISSPDRPYLVNPGDRATLKIAIKNRSVQVDSFEIQCPELEDSWFTVQYPEASPDQPGRVRREKGLKLNPEEAGELLLEFHPPLHTPPGIYSSTLRLHSEAQQDLVLLNIFYIQIAVVDQLSVTFQPASRQFPSEHSTFDLVLRNDGNICRELSLHAQDEDKRFHYRFDTRDQNHHFQAIAPNQSLQIAPYSQQVLRLTPKPRKALRRPWRGDGQEIPFVLNFEHPTALPVASPVDSVGLSLPDPQTGTIVWLPQPGWLRSLLRLLLISLIASLVVAGLLWLAQWLLWKLVVAPSLVPEMEELAATSETYQATGDRQNPIQLNWTVRNPGAITRLEVAYYGNGRQVQVALYEGDRLQQLLKSPNCQEETRQQTNPLLPILLRFYRQDPERETWVCQGIQPQPEAPRPIQFSPGGYEARVKIFAEPATKPPLGELQGVCQAIAPFAKKQTQNQQTQNQQTQSKCEGPLEGSNFQANSPTSAIGQTPVSVPNSDAKTGVQPITRTATQSGGKGQVGRSPLVDSDTLKSIQITPPPPPEILHFASRVPVYRQAAPGATSAAAVPAPVPTTPVQLAWIVDNPREIERLSLRFVNVGFDGKIETGRLVLNMRNGIPVGQESRCRIEGEKLICENIPVPTAKPGRYQFMLDALMSAAYYRDNTKSNVASNGTKASALTKQAEPIEVRPPLPEIKSFKVNGQDTQSQPMIFQSINPARSEVSVALAWQVSPNTTVELLPAPGVLLPSQTSLSYPLNPTPGNTTLVLKATNAAGESVTRSVVVQTAAFVPPPPPPPVPGTSSSANPVPPSLPTVPVPSLPPQAQPAPLLPPSYELPPRSN